MRAPRCWSTSDGESEAMSEVAALGELAEERDVDESERAAASGGSAGGGNDIVTNGFAKCGCPLLCAQDVHATILLRKTKRAREA